MKKILFFAALAAVMTAGMTSCSNDEPVGINTAEVASNNISFRITADKNVTTRGYETNATNALSRIEDFQTWAYDDVTRQLYMGNSATVGREVSNTGTALAPVWSYEPQQFWPVNALNFVAITPYSDACYGTFTTSATANAEPATDSYVTLSVPITLDTDVEDQVDIMMAKADGITAGTAVAASGSKNVPFTFEHALSQILFKGKFNDEGAVTKVTIAEISLCNVKSTGTLVYTSEGTWYGGNLQPTVSGTLANFTLEPGDLEDNVFDVADVLTPAELYTAEDEAENPEHVAGTVKTPAVLRGTTAFDLTVSENATKKNAWMMIPQTTAAWAGPADINATPAEGAYLKVRAQIEKDGVVILGSAAADALYIPLSINWDRSKRYIYTLEFNGANALEPIGFNVVAENWTNGENTDKNF